MNNSISESIHNKLINCPLYYEIRDYLKVKLYESKNVQIDVNEILKSNEFKFKLKNQIYKINYQLTTDVQQWDSVVCMPNYILEAEVKFTKIMRERLLALKQSSGKALVAIRPEYKLTSDFVMTDLGDLFEKEKFRSEVKNISIDQFLERAKDNCIYSLDKAFNMLTLIKTDHPNYNAQLDWCKFKVLNYTPSIEQLRETYNEMLASCKQIGLEEDQRLIDERYDQGMKLCEREYVPYMKKFARRGIPPSLRKKYYRLCLNISNDTHTRILPLKEQVRKYELIIDDFILMELEEITGDGTYFLFFDILKVMYFCLSRDTEVSRRMLFKPFDVKIQQDKQNPNSKVYYPFSGVPFFRKFNCILAPFAYLSELDHECYFVFREFYCKYLSGLYSFSLKRDSIIYLCRLTENLIQEKCPQVYHHMLQLGIYPTDIVYEWYTHFFVGFLSIREIFVLMDRIIGYDSNEIMAIVGASLFYFRSPLIYECMQANDIKELFAELTSIQIVPIILNFFNN